MRPNLLSGVDSATSSVGPVLLIVACFVSTSVCISLEPAPKTQHADGAVSQGIICVPKKTRWRAFWNFYQFFGPKVTLMEGAKWAPGLLNFLEQKKLHQLLLKVSWDLPALRSALRYGDVSLLLGSSGSNSWGESRALKGHHDRSKSLSRVQD